MNRRIKIRDGDDVDELVADANLDADSRQEKTHGGIYTPEVQVAPSGWPEPLANAALRGIAGQVVQTIDPHTESDPAAILFQFLTAFGNVVGRNSDHQVEATHHHPNLFMALVGDTSKARKGTSWGHIDRLFSRADRTNERQDRDSWKNRLVSGLSSGEGLIWEVRDSTQNVRFDADPGISDKRRIVIDSELAATLKVLGRQGNNLSPVIRNAWDSGDLRTLTKNSPAKGTGAHISIIGHITRDELKRELTATEMGNGFANRFLWPCVRRSKLLPEGGNLQDAELDALIEPIRDAIDWVEDVGELKMTDRARKLWREVYADLSAAKPGMLGAVTARAEAQTIRLSLLFALLDCSKVVDARHLSAGLAAWEYCAASARYLFGNATGDPVADAILDELRMVGSRG